MAFLALHKVSSDFINNGNTLSQVYYFLVNSKTYLNIETVSGVRKVIDENEFNSPITKVEELLKAGVLLRLIASGLNGKTRRSYHLLVLRSRAGVVQKNLVDKIIQGTKITSVIVQRKANFY